MDELTSSPRLIFFCPFIIQSMVVFPVLPIVFSFLTLQEKKRDVSERREERGFNMPPVIFGQVSVNKSAQQKKKPTEKTEGGKRNTQGGAREREGRKRREACPRKARIRFVVFLSSLHALFYLDEKRAENRGRDMAFLA